VIESGNVPQLRRRRTRRHRRNRLFRRSLAVTALAIFVAGASALTLKYLSPSLFRAQQNHVPSFEETELSRQHVLTLNQVLQQEAPATNRPVYRYSVIPGGVEDAKELKWVAEHDPVVGAHYAGFDYDHARIVQLTLAQTVYLSYRIGNQIYWTSHRVTLHKGEKLLTDGKITARIRCANRVERMPQQAIAPVEPPVVQFDQPVGVGTAIQNPPVPFQSAFLERPAGFGQTGPLSSFDPIGGGSWVPISPPPLPTGLCGPNKKGQVNSGCCAGVETGGKTKNGPCGSAPGVVPEPGTWVLFASGLIAIYWQARRKLSRA
jgi:hypothetical protein